MQAARLAWKEVVAASSAIYFPEGQPVQLAEAAEEYFPKEQMLHDVALIETSAFFPASHSAQAAKLAWRRAVVASSSMNFPEGQPVQLVEAAGEYSPEEQMLHDVALMERSAFFPASQSMQAARLA